MRLNGKTLLRCRAGIMLILAGFATAAPGQTALVAIQTNRSTLHYSAPPMTNTAAIAASARPISAPALVPPTVLAFDSDSKEIQLQPGEQTAHFRFFMTNVSGTELTIKALRPSCGCTIARMPSQPWRLAPGESAPIEADMNVYNYQGMLSKSLTVETSAGNKYLVLKAGSIAPPARIKVPEYNATQRHQNQQNASMDRQLTLRGECAACHVQPAVGKTGRELFMAACAICHLPENRSPLVFDLQSRKKPMPPDYWKMFITYGKPGTMMPAFAKESTGFLTPAQTASLVTYLAREFPKEGKIVFEMPKDTTSGENQTSVGGADFLPASIGGFSVPRQ